MRPSNTEIYETLSGSIVIVLRLVISPMGLSSGDTNYVDDGKLRDWSPALSPPDTLKASISFPNNPS